MGRYTKLVALLILPFLLSAIFYLATQTGYIKAYRMDLKLKADDKARPVIKQLLEDQDAKSGKPKVIEAWELAWRDIWKNEAKDLKTKGFGNEEIIRKLNPVAAKIVAAKMGVKNPEYVQKAADEYYFSVAKSKLQSK